MRWLILLILVAPLIAACIDGDDEAEASEGAGDFARNLVMTMIRDQWGRTWDMLHPEHQALVERNMFISCNREDTLPDADIAVTEVFEETIDIPHLGSMETTAVTLNISSDVDNSSGFLTLHMIQVDGDWVWFSGNKNLSAYEAGECPSDD